MLLFLLLGLVFLLGGTVTVAEAPVIVRNVDLNQSHGGIAMSRAPDHAGFTWALV